jgi:hypothetical protein
LDHVIVRRRILDRVPGDEPINMRASGLHSVRPLSGRGGARATLDLK